MDNCVVRFVDGRIHVVYDCPGLIDPVLIDSVEPQHSSRMLKKSSSGVLASLRGSTYRSVRLTSSLAAALLDGLFEHSEV